MAHLLRVRREARAVVPADVGVDAAALAAPLVAVGRQTGQTDGGDICPHPSYTVAPRSNGGGGYLAWMFCGMTLQARSSSLSYRRGLSKKYDLEEKMCPGSPELLCGPNTGKQLSK